MSSRSVDLTLDDVGKCYTNLKFEAMQGLFDGKKTLMLHANNPKEIVESIRFAQRSGVKRITIVGGTGALWVGDFLKENTIPVILPSTHDLPNRTDDDVDLPYKLPHLLTQAGVMVSLMDDGVVAWSKESGVLRGYCCSLWHGQRRRIKDYHIEHSKSLRD